MCSYSDNRGEIIISYLYGDLGAAERAAFEAHLAACTECVQEVTELGAVRSQLARWTPPEPKQLVGDAHPTARGSRWWRDVPPWAQALAAVLVLGVAAAIANLEIRSDANGFVVRFGWSEMAAGAAVAQQNVATPASDSAAWRPELAALEQRLQSQLEASTRVAAAAERTSGAERTNTADTVLLRRVESLVAESERRQQRELALRIAGVMRDMDAQRQADLVRIDRSIGVIERNTGVEVMQQRQMLNYLVRTAQTR
jgi:hypothetical protein